MQSKEKIVIKGKFDNIYLKDKNGNNCSLDSIMLNKCILLDFYFVGCPPCEEKLEALSSIQNILGDSLFSVVLICNGQISTFKSFKSDIEKKDSNVFLFLYDDSGFTSQFVQSDGYPFEAIILNKEIIKTGGGFNKESQQLYIDDEIKSINKALNEK
jgi:hypothetical protein